MANIFLITKQKTQNQSIYNQEIAREGKGKGAFLPPNPLSTTATQARLTLKKVVSGERMEMVINS